MIKASHQQYTYNFLCEYRCQKGAPLCCNGIYYWVYTILAFIVMQFLFGFARVSIRPMDNSLDCLTLVGSHAKYIFRTNGLTEMHKFSFHFSKFVLNISTTHAAQIVSLYWIRHYSCNTFYMDCHN